MRMRYPRFVFLSILFLLLTAGSALAKITAEIPTPSINPATFSMLAPSISPSGPVFPGLEDPLTPGLISSAECANFDSNPPLNGGYLFIPPDPMCAAGPQHVVNTGNCYIEWRLKGALTSTPQVQMSLDAFFAGTPGALPLGVAPTNVFDPKCTFDQNAGRFVVVCLQQTTAPADSRILVAVSKTADPNAGWWLNAINSNLVIGGNNHWADYPGLAADANAVYITANMFRFSNGAYGGSRLWIVDKLPTYAGPNGSIVAPVYDAWALSGGTAVIAVGTTTMPTAMWGAEPPSVGTFLVSTGITDNVNEYVTVIRVDTPLAPSFNFQLINVGDISNGTVPSASQLGTTRTIATVSQRVMNAVWRNNNLYTCNTIRPTVGVNSTQATAHWYRLSTVVLGALAVADQGDVGAEDLGTGTHTMMPAVHVDRCDNMAIGFSASGPAIYAGAYYATRALGDAAGTIGGSSPLAVGTDYYIRTFTTSTTAASRWGDYSGLSLCPTDESTFWVYNEYAGPRGTVLSQLPLEDGRWYTRIGSFSECQPVSVAISSFGARYADGAVTLRSTFRSDLGVEAVNVYRAVGNGGLERVDEIFGADGHSFVYTDRDVDFGNTYRYQIGITDADGEFLSPIEEVNVPKVAMSLGQNTPNPFNPTTMINFTLASREYVTVSVYDASGRLVRTLVDDTRSAGAHDVMWDGRDDAGVTVGSGVYFYRLTAGNHTESKKMVMLK